MDIGWLLGFFGGASHLNSSTDVVEVEETIDVKETLEEPVIVPVSKPNVRPTTFDGFVGNRPTIERLKIAIIAAQRRNTPLPHILFYGTQGCGKTTLANIVANEMGCDFKVITGSTVEKQRDIFTLMYDIGISQTKGKNTILFIDEIHDLTSRDAPETLWFPLMEDFIFFSNLNGPIPYGAEGELIAKPALQLNPFTIIGATTDAGQLTAPLRDRFQIQCTLHQYTVPELSTIVQKVAGRLEITLADDTDIEIAKRARGNPRISIGLLRACRDRAFAMNNNAHITLEVVYAEMEAQCIDENGLNFDDYQVLKILSENTKGMGVKNLAGTVGLNSVTLSEMILPFLQFKGFAKTTHKRFISESGLQLLKNKGII